MKKPCCYLAAILLLLSGCSTQRSSPPPPQLPVHTGPVETISGAYPHYEPYSTSGNQDYSAAGKEYRILQNPQNFSQRGQATWYDLNRYPAITANGEAFDPNALTAAHPTLPIPSYVRVTNLNNGRRLVVRINDRGPFIKGKIIQLTQIAVDRLNLTEQSPVQIDIIYADESGVMSGPGTVGTEIARQSFVLPDRPELHSTPAPTAHYQEPSLPTSQTDNHSSTATKPTDEYDPYRLPGEVGLSGDADLAPQASTPSSGHSAAVRGSGKFTVQVGALSDRARAERWQQALSQQFSVPGMVNQNGVFYRVLLGPFLNRGTAEKIQQRLQNEAQQQSIVGNF